MIGNSNIHRVSSAERTKSDDSFKKKKFVVTKKKERARTTKGINTSHHWQHVVLPLDNRSSMCSSNVESSGFKNRLFMILGVLCFPYELVEYKKKATERRTFDCTSFRVLNETLNTKTKK